MQVDLAGLAHLGCLMLLNSHEMNWIKFTGSAPRQLEQLRACKRLHSGPATQMQDVTEQVGMEMLTEAASKPAFECESRSPQ